VRRAIPAPAEAEVVLGDVWERARLLDGLARRLGIQLAEELLRAAPAWWFTDRLGPVDSQLQGAGLLELRRGGRDRAGRAAARQVVRQARGSEHLIWFRQQHGREGEVRVEWPAPPMAVAEAVWAARRGVWTEMAWTRPVVRIWVRDLPLGARRVPLEITLVRRFTPGRVRAVRWIEPEDRGLVEASTWTARPVARLAPIEMGLG
jgi:hypothetical protein